MCVLVRHCSDISKESPSKDDKEHACQSDSSAGNLLHGCGGFRDPSSRASSVGFGAVWLPPQFVVWNYFNSMCVDRTDGF